MSTTENTVDPTQASAPTVTVDAGNLLWVLTEFAILGELTHRQGTPVPPSSGVAADMVDLIPDDYAMPAEALPSLALGQVLLAERR